MVDPNDVDFSDDELPLHQRQMAEKKNVGPFACLVTLKFNSSIKDSLIWKPAVLIEFPNCYFINREEKNVQLPVVVDNLFHTRTAF